GAVCASGKRLGGGSAAKTGADEAAARTKPTSGEILPCRLHLRTDHSLIGIRPFRPRAPKVDRGATMAGEGGTKWRRGCQRVHGFRGRPLSNATPANLGACLRAKWRK